MKHKADLLDLQDYEFDQVIAASHGTEHSKILKVIVKPITKEIYFLVSEIKSDVLRFDNLEDAVNHYNQI